LLITSLVSCKDDDNADPVFERGEVIATILTSELNIVALELFAQSSFPEFVNRMNLTYDVALTKITYQTIDATGAKILASGLVCYPKNFGNNKAPLLAFQHGTILKKDDAPSNVIKGNIENGITLNTGSGFEVGAILASEGYVVAITDYIGMGESPGIHPYVHAATEATAVVDMLRAARQFIKAENTELNGQVFLMGYSQGGHATMAAQRLIESSLSSEFNLVATAPMAGPYDASGTQMDLVLKQEAYASPGYLQYVLYGYNPIYNMYGNLTDIFIDPYASIIATDFTDPISITLPDFEAKLPESKIPTDVLKDAIKDDLINNNNSAVRQALRDNDLIAWTPKTQMKIYHCEKDLHVDFQNAVVAYESFIQRGFTDVEIVSPVQDGDHVTCLVPSLLDAKDWFNSLVTE
jgi:pimeloyl-ACP methyl ester carboxylesterase